MKEISTVEGCARIAASLRKYITWCERNSFPADAAEIAGRLAAVSGETATDSAPTPELAAGR